MQKTINESRPHAPSGKVRWTICAMLFAATSINYMDRQVISLLKPTLTVSIGLTEQSYGYIVAAFQFAYAIGLIAAGRLMDKVGTRIGYIIVMATWSLSAMAHSLATSALGFGIARVFLGLGEAGNFPAAIKTVAEWFPPKERSLATGIFNSGANLGAMLAPATVPWIALHLGWRAAFLSTGLLSAAWIFWWHRNYRKPADHPTLTGEELRLIYEEAAEQMGPRVPWLRLLRVRQTWAFAVGKFLTDPVWWFYLFWLPGFFGDRFHLDLKHLGLPLILIYNMSAVGSIAGGWLPSLFLKFGSTPKLARIWAMLLCALGALPMIAAAHTNSEWVAVAALSLATAAHQGWSANLFTTVSDMFPSSAAASITGIGGMAGSVGGMLLSVSAGRILQLTHSYVFLFIFAGVVYSIAIILMQVLAPGMKRANLTT